MHSLLYPHCYITKILRTTICTVIIIINSTLRITENTKHAYFKLTYLKQWEETLHLWDFSRVSHTLTEMAAQVHYNLRTFQPLLGSLVSVFNLTKLSV